MKYIPEEKLREICSEVNGTFGLYVKEPSSFPKAPGWTFGPVRNT